MIGRMVRIADPIWAAWREQVERGHEPVVLMLLSPAGDSGAAVHALREAVLEVQDAYEAEAQRSGDADPPFPGEWNWVAVPDGVLVQVAECDALDTVLRAVAAGLERRGVDGTLELREPPKLALPPRRAHMLECRLRVRGERLRREASSYRWQADPSAHEAILAVAERWCRQRGDRAAQSLSVSDLAPVRLEPGEDVLDRMRETVTDQLHVRVSAVAADEFRSVAARAWAGGVSLVEGGAWVEAGRWRESLAELTAILRDHADLLAYGFVRRGWAVAEALLDRSLSYDWPPRPGAEPRGIGFTSEAFEDLYAPDAFGVQLLGPGYAGRLPGSAAWRSEPAGRVSALFEHVDLPEWFDAPFVPFGQRLAPADQPEPPAVLAQARVELAQVLHTPGVLAGAGYPDVG
jgi:hypothetical protein